GRGWGQGGEMTQALTAWRGRSLDLNCGTCGALVDKLEWGIVQVDPKRLSGGLFPNQSRWLPVSSSGDFVCSKAHLTGLPGW
uniref:Uncharacterized protein n=1 Tax=Castor canadensis TaxID=51338 RepID=A0A8C0W422_CASCN